MWLFSSSHNTIALIGGFEYRPTMPRTFPMNIGAVDSLKVSWRWGCNPKACQMRGNWSDQPAERPADRRN